MKGGARGVSDTVWPIAVIVPWRCISFARIETPPESECKSADEFSKNEAPLPFPETVTVIPLPASISSVCSSVLTVMPFVAVRLTLPEAKRFWADNVSPAEIEISRVSVEE